MSSSVSRSSKDDHRGSAASAPSDHDEAESLTFFQKKEFFEKLSEQSPPQEALSASRLGSTPSLDTALTRPAVSVKPRPRSESLTSQGEIVEESIVFAERLRLFQGGTQASSGPSAGFPQLDDLAEQQPHQGTEEKGQVAPDPSQPRRLEESQDLEGKGGTRLLVHTSDADKEALDVCSVQVSEDARDQQFSRMRVRVPALEESVAPTESPQPKVSPLRDAYKDSLLTAQQESGQAGKPADPSTVVDDVCLEHGAAADLTVSKAELPNQTNKDTFDRPLTRERDASSLFSSQSHLLASGLQMGIVAGPGILQQGIIASSQSGILETLSSSPTDLMASEFPLRSDVSPEQVGPTEESRGRDVGRIGALVAAAPVAVLPVSDILSGKQLEMLDIAQVPEESSLLEAGVQRPTHGELSQSCPKEKTMIKTEYADIQHKLSSAFGESLAPVESKTSIIQGMPKEVLEAFDRSTQEFVASKLDDEESEQIMHIASATTDSVPREFIPEQGEKVARGATSEPDLEEPARDAASHLTALHLASEHVEIPTEEEMVEEEKLQALMASRLGSESVTREIDEDIYRQDIEEFIAVLEDYEPLPAGHLAKLKPGSRDSEPTLDSKFLSKTEREKDKKAKESSGCVEVCFVDDSTAYDPNSSSQLMGSEGSGLLTEEHSLAKHHDPATLEPSVSGHKDDLTSVPSKTKFKEKEEEHLDESFLISHDREGTSSFSCVGVEVKDQQCVERSLEVTRVSECEESPADDDLVDRAHESTKIDRSPLSTDGSAKDLEALQKGSDSNVQELLDLGNKISDVPLSYGSDDREKESSPEKAVAVAAEVAASLAEYSSHHVVSAGCLEAGADVPCSSDEDQQKELSKYKEVELAIPFLHAGSSSLEEEVEDGGSFSSGDLQAEKIAEFLTADSDLSSEMIHFPQVFQDNLASSLASSTAPSGEKRVGFVLDGATAVLEPDRQGEIEEASRIVDSVVHMASSLVESLHPVGPDVASSEGLCDSGLVHAVGSPPEGSEISETFSQAGPMSAVEKDRQEGLFGVKEMYQVLKESRSTEDRVQYSVMGEPLIADEFDDDAERRRRSSPAAESMDDQAQIEKCSREVMMQLLDGFSKSDVELAEVRTEDEAPDIEDDVPSPEAGSQEEKSVPSSQDNSGDLQPQLSTEVEIGSQASGALAPLSELDYELCPDAERTSGDEVMATGVPPLEPGTSLLCCSEVSVACTLCILGTPACSRVRPLGYVSFGLKMRRTLLSHLLIIIGACTNGSLFLSV
ncbi:hypothetical protein HPB48_006836 [Haemaphysalis longicornis]|uniref:Uncharacterized protein n=1 Tax=Haemaphysalis longicornis TaxID=44386 RepID=A0A9J6FE45_HAELO|nr:hypothetical protein HPB48_006836 [Haemaphysalis longicornis]